MLFFRAPPPDIQRLRTKFQLFDKDCHAFVYDLQGHGRGADERQGSSTETDQRGTGSHSRSAFRERGVLQEHVTYSPVLVTSDS